MSNALSYSDFAPALENRSKKAAQLLHRHLPDFDEEAKILDFGFGDGVLISEFAQLNPSLEFWGIDPMPLQLETLRACMPKGAFFAESDLKYIDKSLKFDLIIASHVYYYFPFDLWGELHRELLGRLNPKGVLAIAMASKHSDIYGRLVEKNTVHEGRHISESRSVHFLHAEDLMRLKPEFFMSWENKYRIDVDQETFRLFYAFVNRLTVLNAEQASHCLALFTENRNIIIDKWLVYRKN